MSLAAVVGKIFSPFFQRGVPPKEGRGSSTRMNTNLFLILNIQSMLVAILSGCSRVGRLTKLGRNHIKFYVTPLGFYPFLLNNISIIISPLRGFNYCQYAMHYLLN